MEDWQRYRRRVRRWALIKAALSWLVLGACALLVLWLCLILLMICGASA